MVGFRCIESIPTSSLGSNGERSPAAAQDSLSPRRSVSYEHAHAVRPGNDMSPVGIIESGDKY
jgi:hypothetical protein